MAMEQLIQGVLLALHNLALVGCAAAPFYNRNLVNTRGQYGPKLHYELDKVVEETLQGNAPFCMIFISVLIATGIAMPLNHLAFHGELRHLQMFSWIALAGKLACVFGMMAIMGQIFFVLNPRLKELFAQFQSGTAPAPESEKEFFTKRARRKALCETCLKLAIGVLVFSAFIGFTA